MFCNQEICGSSSLFETLSVYEETNDIYVKGQGEQYVERREIELGISLGTILGDRDTLKGAFPSSMSQIGIIVNYDMDGNYKGYVSPKTPQGLISRAMVYDDKIYSLANWIATLEHGDSTYNYYVENVGFTLCSWDRQFHPINSINIPSAGNRELSSSRSRELSINNRGEIVVASNFDWQLTFGDHHITTEGTENKMFIAKYGFPCPTNGASNGVFCYGDVYEGTILTRSGDYTFTYPSSIPGVDSVHTLHATVIPPITSGIHNPTACKDSLLVLQANTGYDSYLWSTGGTGSSIEVTYNQVGAQTLYVTITQGSCSATDTIEVTVTSCFSDIAKYQISNLSLYPNPVTDVCRIEIGQEQLERIHIYDMNGREVATHTTLEFSTENLTPGIYIVKVHTTDGKIGQRKMAVSR